jgi:hypothetical protein
MATCPHCHANTIGLFAKAWSSSGGPTQCGACGGLSYIANPHGTSASRAIIFLPLLGVVVLFATGSWRWGVAAVAVLFGAIVAYEAAAFYRTPMVATSSEGAADSRRWEYAGLAILVLVAVAIAAVL